MDTVNKHTPDERIRKRGNDIGWSRFVCPITQRERKNTAQQVTVIDT